MNSYLKRVRPWRAKCRTLANKVREAALVRLTRREATEMKVINGTYALEEFVTENLL